MSNTIKVRSKIIKGVAEVRMLLRHPMQVGRRLKNGEIIKPHFISRLVCEHNGKVVLDAHWGAGISKNPYVAFNIAGASAGDRLTVRWVDNQDGNDKFETTL